MKTYHDLLFDIPNLLDNRSVELADELERIVSLGEMMVSRDLDVPAFKRSENGLLGIGQAVIDKPTGYVSPRYLKLAPGGMPLAYKALDWILEFWPDESEVGTPMYYAELDANQFRIAPSADAEYGFDIGFRGRLDPLSVGNPSNWITEHAYDVLLMACLIVGAGFAKDPAQVVVWNNHYNTLVGSVNREARMGLRDDRREISKDSENRGA